MYVCFAFGRQTLTRREEEHEEGEEEQEAEEQEEGEEAAEEQALVDVLRGGIQRAR